MVFVAAQAIPVAGQAGRGPDGARERQLHRPASARVDEPDVVRFRRVARVVDRPQPGQRSRRSRALVHVGRKRAATGEGANRGQPRRARRLPRNHGQDPAHAAAAAPFVSVRHVRRVRRPRSCAREGARRLKAPVHRYVARGGGALPRRFATDPAVPGLLSGNGRAGAGWRALCTGPPRRRPVQADVGCAGFFLSEVVARRAHDPARLLEHGLAGYRRKRSTGSSPTSRKASCSFPTGREPRWSGSSSRVRGENGGAARRPDAVRPRREHGLRVGETANPARCLDAY